MRVLHLITSIAPENGGTTVALRALTQGCIELGVASAIVTSDTPGEPWLADWEAEIIACGPRHTHFGWVPGLEAVLAAELEKSDVLVLHGLWQYSNLAARRACRAAGRPYIVYPHGMLDPWALRQSFTKQLIKTFVWLTITRPLLQQAARLCFTCPEEQTAASTALRSVPTASVILPLGVEAAPDAVAQLRDEFFQREPGLEGRRILLFLSRLHPKKGCDLLIEGYARWLRTAPSDQASATHLRLAGPPESEAYLQQLQDLCVRHGLQIGRDVSFPGMISGRDKWRELAAAQAMILPSHQENFGIVVVEALACGKTVLLSDRVNIWPWIDEAKAGFVAPDTIEGVVTLIEKWSAMAPDEAQAMQRRASALYADRFSIRTGAEGFVRMIAEVLSASKATAVNPHREGTDSPTV